MNNLSLEQAEEIIKITAKVSKIPNRKTTEKVKKTKRLGLEHVVNVANL